MNTQNQSTPATHIVAIGVEDFMLRLEASHEKLLQRLRDEILSAQQPHTASKQATAYLTRLEAAKCLRISLHSLQERLRDGTVPFFRVGRRVLIPEAAINQLVETQHKPEA
jgi:excisionase family DNA binding protein